MVGALYVVQLLGCRRMIKTIQQNARFEMENSFA